jgi:hypothetical protein
MRDVEIKKIHEALKNSLASARVEGNKWLRTHTHTQRQILSPRHSFITGAIYTAHSGTGEIYLTLVKC